jgi:hypothetical protein
MFDSFDCKLKTIKKDISFFGYRRKYCYKIQQSIVKEVVCLLNLALAVIGLRFGL